MNDKNRAQKHACHAVTSLSQTAAQQGVYITLSTLDNKPERFWQMFLDVLAGWSLLFSQRERQAGFPLLPDELQRFMHNLAEETCGNPLVLVINNRQYVHNPQVQEFLIQLVQFQTKNLLTVLLSQESDELEMLEALQLHGQRYLTTEEEQDYYETNGIGLRPEEFRLVHSFTEGWAPAVVTFAQQPILRENRYALFDDFDGYILQWIEADHEMRFTAEDRRLFLCLPLLDEYPPGVIQSVMRWDWNYCVKVAETSPFLRLNPATNRFYLCGHLRRYLLARQNQLDKKERQRFLIRVGEWYQEQGNKCDAIACYRKAGSNIKVLQVLKQWEYPVSKEMSICYVDTINALPISFLDSHPLLHILRGFCLSTQHRYNELESLMEAFCLQNDTGDDTTTEMRSILGEAYMLWAYCAVVKEDAQSLLQRIKRSAELLPNGSSLINNKVNRISNGPVLFLPNPGSESVEEILKYVQEMVPHLEHVLGGNGAGASHLVIAEAHFYTRNFKKVETYAYKAIYKALDWGQYDLVCSAYFLLMRLNMAKGNYKRLMESLNQLRESAKMAHYDDFFTMPDLAESWLALKMGKKHKIADWLIDDQMRRELIKPWHHGRDHLIHCGYLLFNEAYDEVITFANIVIDLFEKRGHSLMSLHIKLMKAMACNSIGEQEEALHLFEEVYRWVAPNNLIMLVVEYGSYVLPLLSAYRTAGRTAIPDKWLDMVEQKARTYQSYIYEIRKKVSKNESGSPPLTEVLTSMEQKTLLMLCDSMTAKEIAQEQNRSEWAVKSMLPKIYNKMGATGRVDAVRIALEQDLRRYIEV